MADHSACHVERKRTELVGVAGSILASTIDPVVGCRSVAALRFEVDVAEGPVFHPFISHADDMDEFPRGDVRSGFSAAALERTDQACTRHLQEVGPEMQEACRRIIERFSPRKTE